MSWRAVVMLAVGLAVLCVASPVARRVTWVVACNLGRALVGVVALAVVLARDHGAAQRPEVPPAPAGPPSRPVALAWRCTLYLAHGGHTQILATGVLAGPWQRPVEVEDEVLRRYIARFAMPTTGRLCCRAEPVTAPTTRAARPEGPRR